MSYNRYTMKEAASYLRNLRMTIKRTETGEFRINFVGGKEATAYYTTDINDAVSTAEAMRDERMAPKRP